jgi:hypothetical protein
MKAASGALSVDVYRSRSGRRLVNVLDVGGKPRR